MRTKTPASSDLQKIVAINVKTTRLRLGLSQEDLAAICGYHRTYVGAIERAERNITLSTLDALARALGVSPDELMRGNGG